jgi:hypothetical protein
MPTGAMLTAETTFPRPLGEGAFTTDAATVPLAAMIPAVMA